MAEFLALLVTSRCRISLFVVSPGWKAQFCCLLGHLVSLGYCCKHYI